MRKGEQQITKMILFPYLKIVITATTYNFQPTEQGLFPQYVLGYNYQLLKVDFNRRQKKDHLARGL